MKLEPHRTSTLRSVVERLIPRDEFPSGWEAGVGEFLERHRESDLAPLRESLEHGLDALDARAHATTGRFFSELDSDEQDGVLRELDARGDPLVRTLSALCAQGYYGDPGNGGNRGGCAWTMVGYRAGPAPGHSLPARPSAALPCTPPAQIEREYDALVIGAGAGGGVVACVLAEAGLRVLLLERGRSLGYADVPADHLRNQRLPLYGHNAGPDLEGNPRVVSIGGAERVVRPHEFLYQNNATCVGGGTRVFGAQAWRFLPDDFRMASRYGVPPKSSLADWPLELAELEPCYARAEREIGVAGASHPLPPIPQNPQREVLARGAAKLAWPTLPVPMAINTVPYGGRPVCVQCGQCVGFACPSDSKNGSHNTVIPRALATGRCTLVERAQVLSIETDAGGRAIGVHAVAEADSGTRSLAVRAPRTVLCAGAIESARLLLASACESHPRGIGNSNDQVGRHLQGHVYAGAFGLFDEELADGNGPGVSIATCEFNHGNPGVIGGGMLANDFVMMPLMFWTMGLPRDLPRWGLENKRYMAHAYRRTVLVMGPTQEIPHPESRVTLARDVVDRHGMPVARISGGVHAETLRTAGLLRVRAEEWLRASGARRTWSFATSTAPGQPSAGQHQAGTARMGEDPRTSVTDRCGRVHGCEGLWVADGSLHVTNGGFNPVLTIWALAFRTAEAIVSAG